MSPLQEFMNGLLVEQHQQLQHQHHHDSVSSIEIMTDNAKGVSCLNSSFASLHSSSALSCSGLGIGANADDKDVRFRAEQPPQPPTRRRQPSKKREDKKKQRRRQRSTSSSFGGAASSNSSSPPSSSSPSPHAVSPDDGILSPDDILKRFSNLQRKSSSKTKSKSNHRVSRWETNVSPLPKPSSSATSSSTSSSHSSPTLPSKAASSLFAMCAAPKRLESPLGGEKISIRTALPLRDAARNMDFSALLADSDDDDDDGSNNEVEEMLNLGPQLSRARRQASSKLSTLNLVDEAISVSAAATMLD